MSEGAADLPPSLSSAEVVLGTPAPHEHTNSINRSYSDLDSRLFLYYAFVLCAARTAAQQPLNLALARKQTSSRCDAMTTWAIVRSVFSREGGLRGLGQGMAAMTLGCALSEVLYLFLFELGRERLPLGSDAGRDAAAGYGADAACRAIHIPLSIIAFRQMTAASSSLSSSTAVPQPNGMASRVWGPRRALAAQSALRTLGGMYRENGLRAVFAGYGTTLAVGCQWTALWWALYGSLKASMYATAAPLLVDESAQSRGAGGEGGALQSTLPSWCLAKDDNFIINSAASVATGGLTAVVFNPYLVVRTNLQTTPKATLRSVTANIYRTRGIRGFFGGLWLNITTCVVDGALASTSYEYAKLWSDRSRVPINSSSTTTTTTTSAMQNEDHHHHGIAVVC